MLDHPGVAFFPGERKDQELPGLPGFLFNAFDGLRILSRVAEPTPSFSFRVRETVAMETPASRAVSLMVADIKNRGE